MHLYKQTRLQTADQTLLPLCQTQLDADRAAAISSGEPAPNRKIAASSAACCIA